MAVISVIPSNQHRNWYAGQGTTESRIMERMGEAATAEFIREGHISKMFWINGQGASSIDELRTMMLQARAWMNGFPTVDKAVLSLHSDVGSRTIPRHIYPLIRRLSDTDWGIRVGKNMAGRVGFGFQRPTIRAGLLYYTMLTALRGKALLLEVGQHNIPEDAAFNIKYAEFLGIMAARAFLGESGFSWVPEWRVPRTVAVPPGLEWWYGTPGATDPHVPPVGVPPTLKIAWWQRRPFFTNAYTRGPWVMWLQHKLNDRYPELERLEEDGIYGPDTEGRVKVYQTKQILPVDGVVNTDDWDNLLLDI